MCDRASPDPKPPPRALMLLTALLLACREEAPDTESAQRVVGAGGAGDAGAGGSADGGGSAAAAGRAGGAGTGASGGGAFYGDECLPHPAGFDRRNASCYYLYGAAACLEQGDPLLQKKISGECFDQQIAGPYCFFGPADDSGDSCCYLVAGGLCNGRPLVMEGSVRLAHVSPGAW